MSFALQATPRTILGKKVKQLRRQGQTPVVLYGHGSAPRSLATDAKMLQLLWKQAGSNQLVDVTVDTAKSVKALLHDVQIHPVSDQIVHADLYEVKMTEKIE